MDKEMHNVAGSPPPYSGPSYPSNPRPPPPSGYYQTPPPHAQAPAGGYAPAPPVFQQQSNNNVVVVGQQPQPALVREVHHVRSPNASTYIVLTAVMMVLCFLHGNLPAFVCLVPALICSCAAIDHNSAGQYNNAKDCGSYALCCNIFSVTYFVIAFIGGVVVVAVYLTVGFGIVSDTIHDATDNINNIAQTTCESRTGCYWSSWDKQCYCY